MLAGISFVLFAILLGCLRACDVVHYFESHPNEAPLSVSDLRSALDDALVMSNDDIETVESVMDGIGTKNVNFSTFLLPLGILYVGIERTLIHFIYAIILMVY
jgi:hypothetical protein